MNLQSDATQKQLFYRNQCKLGTINKSSPNDKFTSVLLDWNAPNTERVGGISQYESPVPVQRKSGFWGPFAGWKWEPRWIAMWTESSNLKKNADRWSWVASNNSLPRTSMKLAASGPHAIIVSTATRIWYLTNCLRPRVNQFKIIFF